MTLIWRYTIRCWRMTMDEKLIEMLKFIRLRGLIANWERYLMLPGGDFSHVRLLKYIIEEEFKLRKDNSRRMRLQRAQIPENTLWRRSHSTCNRNWIKRRCRLFTTPLITYQKSKHHMGWPNRYRKDRTCHGLSHPGD